MIGMVLAAGAGRRLESLTEDLPKTLLPVDGDRTILDIALGNLRRAGMETVVVVTGYAAERIEERREALEQRHEVQIETVFSDARYALRTLARQPTLVVTALNVDPGS